MFKKMSWVTALLLLLGLMLTFSACKSASEPDTASAAKIRSFTGQVTVSKAGDNKSFSAVEGMLLTQGDRITTGKDSAITLDLGEEQELRVSENTDLTIKELIAAKNAEHSTQIGLDSGCLWAEVKKELDPNERFEIATPTAVMGVRGTKFAVSHSDGASKLAVFAGKVAAVKSVEIIRPDGSKTIKEIVKVLEQNQQTEIDESVTTEEDIQILPVSQEDLDPFIQEIIREQGLDLPDTSDNINISDDTADIDESAVNNEDTSDENEASADEDAFDNNSTAADNSVDDKSAPNPDPVSSFEATLPAGYPQDVVPILPGARVVYGVKEAGNFAVSIIMEKGYQEVLQYYRSVMQNAAVFMENEINGAFVLTGIKSGYYISLTGEPQHVDGKEMMTLVIAMAPAQ